MSNPPPLSQPEEWFQRLNPQRFHAACLIETDMTAALPEAVRTEMAKDIPAGRAGQPEDVANAVAFFAAEQSSYLTGQVLCVDGGMAM